MKPKAKQNKGRDCRLNATVTIEEKAALDRLAAAGGFKSTSALIGALAVHIERIGLVLVTAAPGEEWLGPYLKSVDEVTK
ncbi:hypothetical protein CCP3SC15_360024 [Gammaproteobacteria bacterium]